MSFYQKLLANQPTLSYEFFPPKSSQGWATLYSTLAATAGEHPDYVSVTYGAGGSTREKTVDLVSRIQKELGIESVAHLTCVGHSREEIYSVLQSLSGQGVQNVLALRGDPPKGKTRFTPHPNGFRYASELIEFIHKNFPLNIGCACYPEKHLEAKSLDEDIDCLKLKQDMGAKFAITQMFFDNNHFYQFSEQARKQGVTIPLIAGIMPATSPNQLSRFVEMTGTDIPDALANGLEKAENSAAFGVKFATSQCEDLLKKRVAGIHLYTLNKSNASVQITENLRRMGYFPLNENS